MTRIAVPQTTLLGLSDPFAQLRDTASSSIAGWVAAGAGLLVVVTVVVLVLRAVVRAVRRRPSSVAAESPRAGSHAARRDAATAGRRWLIGLAVTAAVGVAALGGVRSFEAVSVKFGSALVPLTADGMIIACTALRLAALTRGWRLPGSVATTYGFIAGTVWLNVAAAHGWTDAVAHALAPVSYAVLVEMLAHLLRLHLRLAQPSRPRVTALTWFTSPVVTTRVWLHMARTGEPDPLVARALVQQLIRMASRLAAVCPSRPGLAWLPVGQARAARVAALQTIRDGLLTAADLASLLPTDTTRLAPATLLALVDRAALQSPNPTAPVTAPARTDQRTASRTTGRTGDRTGDRTADETSAPSGDRISAPGRGDTSSEAGAAAPAPAAAGRDGRDGRTDDELVVVLRDHAAVHNDGRPLSQREVMRVLGVGTPKAKRLTALAGWLEPTTTVANPAAHHQRPAELPGQLALVEETSESGEADTDSPSGNRENIRVTASSSR